MIALNVKLNYPCEGEKIKYAFALFYCLVFPLLRRGLFRLFGRLGNGEEGK